jgi:uncharacterized membrane protein YccC
MQALRIPYPRGAEALLRQQIDRLHLPQDPGLAAFRRASRAALVASSVFAFAQLVLHDVQFTTFVVFGCFALIVLADFGGLRRPRAMAYIGATLVGALFVALGSAVSVTPWEAALAMFAIGFSVQFASVFGSYAAVAQPALLLSFVLAASIAAPDSAIGSRVAGWCVAGVLATLAGVFLWPRFERDTLRKQAAAACRALAALITAEREGVAQAEMAARRTEAQEILRALRQAYASTPKRPAGPARGDRAFAELLAELERLLALIGGPLGPLLSADHPCLNEGMVLLSASTQALENSALVLVGGAAPALTALEAARMSHRQALDRWAGEALQTGTPPEEVLDRMQADDALRIVSYLVQAAGGNAVIAAGGSVDTHLHLPLETPRAAGIAALVGRAASTVRTHLSPRSTVLHASLRVGIGLAIAVFLSRELRLDHSFWVVLASLSVLRTNALATGRTTVQALTGTIGGFAISAIFLATVGSHSTVLWLSLPCAIFLASYAASRLGFLAGQAAFTVTVVILFNLIAPAGWSLGLVRVEDVAIGAAISVVSGLLLWPRGARGEFRTAMADLFDAVGEFLGRAFDHALQHGARSEVLRARARAVRAHERAGEAFDRLLWEHRMGSVEPEHAAAMVVTGAHALVAGDLLSGMAVKGYQAPNNVGGLADLHIQAHVLVTTFAGLAAYLRTMKPVQTGARVADMAIRDAALRLIRDWKADPGSGRAAITAVTLSEWLQLLSQLVAGLEQPVAETVAAARVPWWR